MENLKNRHYYLFFTGAFFCIIALMTSLSVLTIFVGAFPEKVQSFFRVPVWMTLFFYFAPCLLLLSIDRFSAQVIDFAFSRFFHRPRLIDNSTYLPLHLQNKKWQSLLRGSFRTFGLSLVTVIAVGNKIFYWLRQRSINFSYFMMVGTILIYILALWFFYQQFMAAAGSYLLAREMEQNLSTGIQLDPVDPTLWESPNNGTIDGDENGFYLNDDYGEDFVAWSQIREVRGYKQGHGLNICLGLDFLTEGPVWWKVKDNMAGYYDMQSSLPRKLPGFDENWANKIFDPEVQEEHYVIRDNMAGYYDMQSSLPRKLPGFDENWADKVLDPEFQEEHYVIWKRKI